ncbi:MAG: hypothetical protein ABMA00_03880 [Gemmatimonas sp.]
MWCRPTLGLLLGVVLAARTVEAQQDSIPVIKVTANWQVDRFRDSDELIELTLDRTLASTETLALVIGTLDVTSLTDVSGSRVRYRPLGNALPGGDSEITVYVVRDKKWTEVAKIPIKVRNRLGLDEGRVLPTIDLNSAGQLKQGGTDTTTPARPTYQDVTLRVGVESNLARAPWTVSTQANALGVSTDEQRLRFESLQAEAPQLDLSDYKVEMTRGGSSVQLGNIRVSGNPQLLNRFSSRGIGGTLRLGSAATVDAGIMNGSNVVGWTNALGLAQSAHRLSSARLSLELKPSRPGAIHLDLSGLDGSVLPIANFNQGSVTDAEQSSGWGSQLALSDAAERFKFSGGIARSKFTNPTDRLLSGDSTIVAVKPLSRTARFGEATVQLLKDRPVRDSLTASVSAVLRHERVDPLYRSLGASMQADAESNAAALNGAVGALTLQARVTRARDNLAQIASILTSRTAQSAFNAAMPLSSVIGPKDAWYLPLLSYGRESTHQYGEGTPLHGEFTESDVPDQASVNQTGSMNWTREATTVSYRWNQSLQDNRQPGRELADIKGTVHGLSMGLTPLAGMTVTLEASRERQRFTETEATQELDRVGANIRWQLGALTDLATNVSRATSLDGAAGVKTTNMELQMEASRAFTLYRLIDGKPQARVFLRFARVLASQHPQLAGPILSRDLRWTLNAGGSVRFY